jgi:glycosyltransferase involved in cell wall biosynthesis
MTTIWVNTIVRNEERYLWFAVKSVIDYVDKILIWDTGSTDRTVEIIKKLQETYPDKIDFKEVGSASRKEFSILRQKMLSESDCDWILVLDGDELWWQVSIKEVIATILVRGGELDSIVTPYLNLVGDIYHKQEEAAGRYKIDGRMGHLTIRAINKAIPGLHIDKPYGQEGFFDGDGEAIQKRDSRRRLYIDAPYLHLSHLSRSSKNPDVIDRPKKIKFEIGERLPLDFYFPEVLFLKRPNLVCSPWRKADLCYWLKASLLSPARFIKRRLLHG